MKRRDFRGALCVGALAAMGFSPAAGCVGEIATTEDPDSEMGGAGGSTTPIPGGPGPVTSLTTGVRRLTSKELSNTLIDLVDQNPADLLYGWPEETRPF